MNCEASGLEAHILNKNASGKVITCRRICRDTASYISKVSERTLPSGPLVLYQDNNREKAIYNRTTQ